MLNPSVWDKTQQSVCFKLLVCSYYMYNVYIAYGYVYMKYMHTQIYNMHIFGHIYLEFAMIGMFLSFIQNPNIRGDRIRSQGFRMRMSCRVESSWSPSAPPPSKAHGTYRNRSRKIVRARSQGGRGKTVSSE